MTVVRDPVFEQHYAKKVNVMLQMAGQEGFDQGFAYCISIIDHFNRMEMPITPQNIQLFLQGQQNIEMKKAETRSNAKKDVTISNPCSEITLEPPKQSPFTVIK